jgi:spoOJ protein
MSTAKNKNVLGRGLGNLLGGETATQALQSTTSIQELPLEKIAPNPDQPRKHFEQEALEELAASLKALGLVQPITVQALPSGSYQIISGERRWRAAQMAGLKTLPAYIRATQPSELLELALIENIQREDLNAIEVALAYQQLTEQYGLSQSKVAERVGKKRVTVTNYIRLLQLPAEIQLGLTQRLIDMGHARALLQVDDTERQIELYNLIITEHLSVRAVEELARAISEAPETTPLPTPQHQHSEKTERKDFKLLEQHLAQVFSSKVTLRCSASGKGKLTIPFSGDEELERIMQLLERIQK